MFEKEIVIDAKGHLMGRLASIVAKTILSGQRVIVVRAEKMVMSGKLFNRRVEYLEFKKKNSNTNPRKGGAYHFKAPSKIFWRAVRGMTPHKTKKAQIALERLKVFEGCPYPYSHKKKFYVHKAMKAVRLKNGRKFCLLGELAASIGWNKGAIVEKLENKRLERAERHFLVKKNLQRAIDDDIKGNSEIQKLQKELSTYGY